MFPNDPYALAAVCWAAGFLLGVGITVLQAWALIARSYRLARKWRNEADKLRAALRHERLARRSPVQQFNDRRNAVAEYDPPVVPRYFDQHPPMRKVPIVRGPDDTQVIGRIDQTGDVT